MFAKLLNKISNLVSKKKQMNKTLYLIRHATAEDGAYSPMFKDFDRELTSSGIIEAARMGKFLKNEGKNFDYIASSCAIRAKETAKIFAEQMGFDVEKIDLNESIYGGGPRAYLAAVNALSDEFKAVAIFGHNPDITFFAEYLTRADVGGSMEKAAVIKLAFDEKLSWADVSSKMGQFLGYHSPSTIRGEQD